MRPVEVQQTRDTAIVADLLSRWKTDVSSFVRSSRMVHFVAWLEGVPVGVLSGHHDWGNWGLFEEYQHLPERESGSYVAAIYVDPDVRSQGIGTALLRAFTADAEAAGSPLVITWPDEHEAGREVRVGFFARNGFAFLAYPNGSREPWLMGRPLR